MNTDDTVDRTIRNQRYSVWPGFAGFGLWGATWLGLAYILEQQFGPLVEFPKVAGFVLATVASFAAWMFVFSRFEPVKRLKLGSELRAIPVTKCKLKDICVIRFAHDPLEDYAEKSLPIQFCEVAILRHNGRPLKLIISFGDAARVREWAEQHGVAVDDPQRYSSRIREPETRQ